MKHNVVLSIRGKQNYGEQEPDVIELLTDGTMEYRNNGWDITYEESDLTGLAGVTTTFRVEPKKITLTRTGRLQSQMVFQEGVFHESLYQMEFGAMLITVCASKVEYNLSTSGGSVDLVYGIDIEQTAVGIVDYHLQVTCK